jgi:hypothetical protein
VTTALTPLTYALSIGTSSALIVPANPSRKGLMFFNPSANTVAICPAINSSGLAQAATLTGAGSINLLPNAMLVVPPPNIDTTAGLGAAWNAIASGPGPFTVWEF